MKFRIISLWLLLVAATGHAQELAACRDPSGPTYFHYAGGATKEGAGWSKDKINGGRISLVRAGEQIDILFTDIRLKPFSAVADGGRVVLLRISDEAATVLVNYPKSSELYTFFQERDGRFKFTMYQTKTGDNSSVPKSALLLGDCEPFDFSSRK